MATIVLRVAAAMSVCFLSVTTATPAVAQILARDTIVVTKAGITIERVDYVSGGHEVFGYLAAPEGPGPFPVVVRLRGGNRSFGAYSPERAVRSLSQLAEWGYVAIAPQYRGATDPEEGESADEFGGAEVDDIFTMIDLLPRSTPAADTSRVGLDGWSRGGMMALLALRRSERFRAAVLVGAMSDLERMVAVPGADHSLSDAAEERDAERRAWFDRYVRDLEPVPR